MTEEQTEILNRQNVNRTMRSITDSNKKQVVSFIPVLSLGDFVKIKAGESDLTNGELNVINTHNTIMMMRRMYPEYPNQGLLDVLHSLPYNSDHEGIIREMNDSFNYYNIKASAQLIENEDPLKKEIGVDIIIEGSEKKISYFTNKNRLQYDRFVTISDIEGVN